MTKYQYSLARKGKWICPACGRKTFVRYVDTNGNTLDESVGKCDRANNCAYHKPPREFFEEHGLMYKNDTYHRPKRIFKPRPLPSYINPDEFKKTVIATQSKCNHLLTYLSNEFGHIIDEDVFLQMKNDYFIGTSDYWKGSTVFWQIDRFGKVHAGKIMLYDPNTGKRVKEPYNRITWYHTANRISGFNLSQCLFGEHLLNKRPNAPIIIVESEKTAIIMSMIIRDGIIMACGGCNNLTLDMCKSLAKRDVILFPDNGKFEEWSEKGTKMRYMFQSLSISDIMEREAEAEGDDIADLLLSRPSDFKSLDLGVRKL